MNLMSRRHLRRKRLPNLLPQGPRRGNLDRERGKPQCPPPTSYLLPFHMCLLPPIDTSPEQPLLSETIEGSANDDNWKEDLWDPIEGENKQQVEQRLAHNRRVTKEHEKKMKNKGKNTEEELRQRHQYNMSRPGRVPDGLGVVTVNQLPERNNAFPGLLARHFYHSPSSNRVFMGNTAVKAAQAEMNDVTLYTPDANRRLYTVVRCSLPMNPQEMHNLATLVANFRELALDHAEGFLLLGEL
jgi:hypothetical protein